ncbi:hypothetical protein CAEBREN_00095 [Caenorhabditis brenneri]|uniref:Protein kinase domain-containing protein n=1 Tax=Caenorhabditis brenneri TaxID=135651 RepID=G0P587_CAEBE|nr:hypothetical protein CAEBREN_00095 [Caenorhabditis brenneri]
MENVGVAIKIRPITVCGVKYTQGTFIGHGAFGTVWKANGSDKTEAVFKHQKVQEGNTKLKIMQEYEIHRDLTALDKSGQIIKMLGMSVNSKGITLVLELAEKTLHSVLSDLTPAETQKYFRALIFGVEFLHEQMIAHCDLSLKNLLILDEGTLKIADFGNAKRLASKEQEMMSADCRGNPQYCAPELFEDGQMVKVLPLDTWSCGIVLLQLAQRSDRSWTQATPHNREYQRWSSGRTSNSDFWAGTDKCIMCKFYSLNSMRKAAYFHFTALVKKILCHDPTKRATIAQIKHDQFFKVDVRAAIKRSGAATRSSAKVSRY